MAIAAGSSSSTSDRRNEDAAATCALHQDEKRSRHDRWLKCAGFAISHQPFCHQAGFFSGLPGLMYEVGSLQTRDVSL
jgi:hypothetical protein